MAYYRLEKRVSLVIYVECVVSLCTSFSTRLQDAAPRFSLQIWGSYNP